MNSLRQKKKLVTRERIKSTAKKFFIEKGVAATNTRAISKECGVAVGTFFSHFPDKLSLIKELFFEEMDLALQNSADESYIESRHPVTFFEFYTDILFSFYGNNIESTHLVLMDSLINGGFFTQQMQVLQGKSIDKFCKVGVDRSVAQVFCENMAANFLHVLLGELSNSHYSAQNAQQRLTELNKPFFVSYQSALSSFNRQKLRID